MSSLPAVARSNPRESLARHVEHARKASAAWLQSMQAHGASAGVLRISDAHDPSEWPGMLLPGTYNGIMAARLLGALDAVVKDRPALIRWLEGFRRRDGVFGIPEMRDGDVFKKPDRDETWRYIDFHLTNYSLGAIEALDPERAPELAFVRSFLDPVTLKAWLADRDLRDPWQEGNNIVNLGSFLLLLARFGNGNDQAAVRRALDILFDWHDRHQEPSTGFWGVGQLSDPTRLLHAMAGSMHNFHLWYATGRPLPFHDRAVAYCLSLPPAMDSACIDVDIVDVLVHGHRILRTRQAEIETWLERMLDALLTVQNPDGGFPDVLTGIRRQDGWVRGYAEPQGISNTFATFFRWIAIAMIADLLWPGRWPWEFRRMIGIGYRRSPW